MKREEITFMIDDIEKKTFGVHGLHKNKFRALRVKCRWMSPLATTGS